jgi:hypothetical protein
VELKVKAAGAVALHGQIIHMWGNIIVNQIRFFQIRANFMEETTRAKLIPT